MRALVFAAGLGTRLRPFTLEHPKALVEVGTRPMLERVCCRLRDTAGVDTLVINVHHFASQIVDFVTEKQGFGIDTYISDESSLLLDTGGGILAARKWLDGNDAFFVHNADVLTNVNLEDMMRFHMHSGADITLLCTSRATQRYLCFDRDSHRLCGWVNLATGETRPESFEVYEHVDMMAFDGVHVISPRVFDALQSYAPAKSFSVTPFYIDSCRVLDIRAYVPRNNDFVWFDVGRPETLDNARKWVALNSL